MEKKDWKKCDICDGKYPEDKHNFEECYSMDVEWDLEQMDNKEYEPVVSLDQFYTKPSIAKKCWEMYKKFIPKTKTWRTNRSKKL